MLNTRFLLEYRDFPELFILLIILYGLLVFILQTVMTQPALCYTACFELKSVSSSFDLLYTGDCK